MENAFSGGGARDQRRHRRTDTKRPRVRGSTTQSPIDTAHGESLTITGGAIDNFAINVTTGLDLGMLGPLGIVRLATCRVPLMFTFRSSWVIPIVNSLRTAGT
jgi:hypothetical protein